MSKRRCQLCEETSEYVPLVPKPLFFINDNKVFRNVTSEKNELICIRCLESDIEMLKECY